MADPVQLILDFLRRNQFSQAEEAFVAELMARRIEGEEKLGLSSSSTKALDLESQAWIPLPHGSHNRNRDEWTMSRNGDENLVTSVRNPPEKQVFVTYESGKSEPQADVNTSLYHHKFLPDNLRAASGSEATTPHTEASSFLQKAETMKPLGSLGGGVSTVMQFAVENRICETTGQSSAYSKSEVVLGKKLSKKPIHDFPSSESEDDQDHLQTYENAAAENIRQDIKSKDNRQQDCLTIKGNDDRQQNSSTIKDNDDRQQNHSIIKGDDNRQQGRSSSGNEVEISLSNIPQREAKEDRKASGGPEQNDLELRNGLMDLSTSEGPVVEDHISLSHPLRLRASESSERHQGVMPVTPFHMEQKDEAQQSLCHREVQSSEQRVKSEVEESRFLPNVTRNFVHEGLPRLPPVRLHSIDKNMDIIKDSGSGADNENSTRSFASESAAAWADAPPLTQDMLVTGLKRPMLRLSVSQGIVEDDMSEQLAGFVTALDGQSERWYPDDYCDSDTWDDDDDLGYHRQPIEDEDWFFANEIDYPSDVERSRNPVDKDAITDSKQPKRSEDDDEDHEGDSYFSGEEYYRLRTGSKDGYNADFKNGVGGIPDTNSDLYSRNAHDGTASRANSDGNNYDNHLFDAEDITLMEAQPNWKDSVYEPHDLEQTHSAWNDSKIGHSAIVRVDDDKNGSVRSGVQASSDVADIGSSEADSESIRDQDLILYDSSQEKFDRDKFYNREEKRHVLVKNAPVQHFDEEDDDRDMVLQYYDEEWCQSQSKITQEKARSPIKAHGTNVKSKDRKLPSHKNKSVLENGGFMFEGFSFPSPSSTGDVAPSRAESGKSIWSNRETTTQAGEKTDSRLGGPDNTLAAWKKKSIDSSPIIESCGRNTVNHSASDERLCIEARVDGVEDLDEAEQLEDVCQPSGQGEDSVAQEEMRTFVADEDQFETFDLRIIHRKNRTGFEEDKEFPVMINSVVAGRYHVTEYLGSAAFSKAIQAHDLHTGIDVCMKIIKNNKDFFDQSLDEIKLLKYVNKHDPADKYHILRLYDYFYHREHLFIVCELLRANLYEFQKFNRESGGEVYFTMPRLQSITIQCLEALEFLHKLGIIHCDLKPENILVKSYSRCEVKVIDLGSSCFQTDHLCSYVQSRSYRAPEVILGHSYDQKIDIWSLGCILAELCTGNVLFQNDSLATLLARVVGILGPIDPEVLAKGRDTYKYFTKNHMLYERNQETDQLEYLMPKKTSLRHRLPMGDQGFIEFVGYLLQNNPAKRPSASEALQHPWLSYPYEPISS